MNESKADERFTDDSAFGPVIQKRADEQDDKENKSLQDNNLQKGKIVIKRAPRHYK